jgi:hypothetical protein
MKRSILEGKWVYVGSEKNFNVLQDGRVNKGNYNGPGKYLLLEYQEKCPRGCCYDDVVELMSTSDVIYEVKEEMKDLANLLRTAREKDLS